jgi:hypothetical protein
MKRAAIYLLGLILVAAAAAAVLLAIKTAKSHDGTISDNITQSNQTSPVKKACAIFTLNDAKILLGDNAKGGQNTTDNSSGDLIVSTCSYTQDTGNNAQTASTKSATLLETSPTSDKGKTSNQNQFGPLKPLTAQDVSGYGDSAYWDSQYGQLDVLKNSIWYVLSYGPTSPGDRTLDQTKQMADLLINKM